MKNLFQKINRYFSRRWKGKLKKIFKKSRKEIDPSLLIGMSEKEIFEDFSDVWKIVSVNGEVCVTEVRFRDFTVRCSFGEDGVCYMAVYTKII